MEIETAPPTESSTGLLLSSSPQKSSSWSCRACSISVRKNRILSVAFLVLSIISLVVLFFVFFVNPDSTPSLAPGARARNEWTWMFYYAANNNLENYTFVDFAKLTSPHLPEGITHRVHVHMLISTKTQGTYRVKMIHDAHTSFEMKRLDSVNMSSPEQLREFLEESVRYSPAHHYAVVYSGHGASWYLETEEYSILPISVFSSILSSVTQITGTKLSVVIFDCCLMSLLETIYQVAEYTHYVMACETYGPWEGFISPSLLSISANNSISVEDKLIFLARDFINRNVNGTDPSDVAVVKTSEAVLLSQMVLSLNLTEKDIKTNGKDVLDTVDDTHDLSYVIQSLPDSRLSPKNKEHFNKLFSDSILIYLQNSVNGSADYNPYHNGISICRNPSQDNNAWAYYQLDLQPVKI